MQPRSEAEKSKHVKQDEKWITLKDPLLVELILKAIGDDDKKNIINAVIDESRTISEMIEISEVPQTSGYRKINSLIDDGLLIRRGHIITHDGKKIAKYQAMFDNIRISIEKNKIIVTIHPTQDHVD